MLASILEFFEIVPDYNLSIMKSQQDLTHITVEVLKRLQPILVAERPNWILVHGDTTTAMAAALAAFYANIPVGHVEAGLRTGSLLQPWPEEMNRRVVDRISDRFFAPTLGARDNLLNERVPDEKIVVTGNTVIDALFTV